MDLTKNEQSLLEKISDLHEIPQGAFNLRKNGEGVMRTSTDEIQIIPKKDKPGIDIIIKENVKNKSVHIPVIISQSGLTDLVYNDFYIGENAEVLIVAGCGIHNDGLQTSEHNGIHTFHLAPNCKASYIEKHLGEGTGADKILNPTTQIEMQKNSFFEMETIQLSGVTSSVRKTEATLEDGAHLVIKEKIKTTDNQTAKTKFNLTLNGQDCSAKITSRSVASDYSYQEFDSNVVGKNACFGHVECDGLLSDNARIVSTPKLDAQNVNAKLIHEATVGKIAGEQLTKLTTLGLTPKQAEELIIKAYLK